MLTDRLVDHFKYLAGEGNTALAVAFSGGGDSTALLALLIDFLPNRKIYALIVDHRLRDGSANEALLAADRAKAMGASTEILIWEHDGVSSALQEKARHARYGLLGDACRRLGVEELFLGHSLDDQAETIWMRREKGSGWRGLAGMQIRVRAPIWPALYGVEIIRPLLNETRAEIRLFNKARGLEFIEDPSNQDRSFRRIQARNHLAYNQSQTGKLIQLSVDAQSRLQDEKIGVATFFKHHCKIKDWGGVALNTAAVQREPNEIVAALRLIIPSVSGQGGFPPTSKIEFLVQRMQGQKFKSATIGGVWVLAAEGGFLIVRDKGMVLGRNQRPGLAPVPAPPDRKIFWDGRFLITAKRNGLTIVPLETVSAQLDKPTKLLLKAIPISACPSLPAIVEGLKLVHIPFVQTADEICTLKELTSERLKSLLGRADIDEKYLQNSQWRP